MLPLYPLLRTCLDLRLQATYGNLYSTDVTALQGQQSLPRRIIKYAGTSDIIYEDLNNPFDKHRGPARARRCAQTSMKHHSGHHCTCPLFGSTRSLT